MFSGFKDEILAQYGPRLAGAEYLELEAKFGTIKDGIFVNEIPYAYFDRLMTTLSKSITPIESKTTDETSKDRIRKSTSPDGEITYLRKTKLWEKDSTDFGVRLTLSSEDKLSESEIPNGWTGDTLRVKTRWTFPFDNGNYKLDLTSVDQTIFSTKESSNRFEIELELVDKTALDKFFNELYVIFKLIYATEEIWTFPERNKLIENINKLLGGNPTLPFVDISAIRQPRNLRWNDLVYGGIVGNPHEKYVIYHKVDGFRKLLVCAESGVWIVYPQHEFNKISNDVVTESIGSILFVEEVPPENRKIGPTGSVKIDVGAEPVAFYPKATYWLHVFDCVSYLGDSSVASLDLEQRTQLAQKVTNMLKDFFEERLLSIGTSRYRVIRNPIQFFDHCREFLDEESVLEYKTDGLIFAPMMAPAQHHSDKRPLSDRVLTRYPDSCKWKPQHLLTNDLSLKWTINAEGIKTLDVETYTLVDVQFTEAGLVSSRDPKLINLPSGTIVRFGWHISENRLFPRDTSNRPTPMNIDEARRRLIKAQDRKIDHNERKRISFDLKIIKGEGIKLYASRQTMVPFRGTKEYPFNPKDIKTSSDSIKSLDRFPTGTVVEFQTEGGIKPIKIRYDKTLPNRLDIVEDNWNLSKNPISEDTLRGKTFDLLERYKERTLVRLLNFLPSYNKLLFIGEVPRVDTSIFSKFESVNIISPKEVNLPSKVKLEKVNIGPGVLDKIESGYDAILFYQSLDRIFNRRLLDKLFSILPINGFLAYIDLDTDAIKHLFFPEIRGPIPDKDGTTIGPIIMRWNLDALQPIKIIEGKKERNFSETSLFTFLESGLRNELSFRLDGEPLLHQAEKFFGDLHAAIVLSKITKEHGTPSGKIPEEIKEERKISEEFEEEYKIPSGKIPEEIKEEIRELEKSPKKIIPEEIKEEIRELEKSPKLSKKIIPEELPERISEGFKIPMETIPQSILKEIPIHVDEKIDDPKLTPDEKATIKAIDGNNLPLLPVVVPVITRYGQSSVPKGEVAAGDDTYENVVCTWYPGKVVRIATIGDGSCFFHAVLKGYDPVYQENNEAAFRIELVAKLRRDLAAALELEDPDHPDMSYYETAANGAWVAMADQQRENPSLIRQIHLDFSLPGLQALFNSNDDVGEEVYQYVSDMLGVDIYVLRGTTTDLWPHINTSKEGKPKRSVVIMGNTNHYEVIGIDTPEGFQTMFQPDHGFLIALRGRTPKGNVGGYK